MQKPQSVFNKLETSYFPIGYASTPACARFQLDLLIETALVGRGLFITPVCLHYSLSITASDLVFLSLFVLFCFVCFFLGGGVIDCVVIQSISAPACSLKHNCALESMQPETRDVETRHLTGETFPVSVPNYTWLFSCSGGFISQAHLVSLLLTWFSESASLRQETNPTPCSVSVFLEAALHFKKHYKDTPDVLDWSH